ncbi:kinase-like protein, partial [Dothidotthia symphoricarpi CBS 119687]
DWKKKQHITRAVSLVQHKTAPTTLLIKKVLAHSPKTSRSPFPAEIRALNLLPRCNRVLIHTFYAPSTPDTAHGTAFYAYCPLGDVMAWKETHFDDRNKPVPESHIWRFFLQISQALAFLQCALGPATATREVLLHRDIKPENVLVVHNGTAYPSFKLHDFDCMKIVKRTGKTRRTSICGTFEWQGPENPRINNTAAEVWAVGACVYFLAVGEPPVGDVDAYGEMRRRRMGKKGLPKGARVYPSPEHYFAARVPRRVVRINLSREEQEERGISSLNHRYGDELNDWMMRCLSHKPDERPTTEKLVDEMGPVARGMLEKLGGKAALVDMDVTF